ncbi:MAG: hypothetical protein HC834_06460 [Rhodospirillales bacterium]|nr:hypothetical protein [Rhodospirillales bacterium]
MSSVDFPHPDGPRMQTNWPGMISTSVSATATLASRPRPNVIETFSTLMCP